jgi:hypothetical protein
MRSCRLRGRRWLLCESRTITDKYRSDRKRR